MPVYVKPGSLVRLPRPVGRIVGRMPEAYGGRLRKKRVTMRLDAARIAPPPAVRTLYGFDGGISNGLGFDFGALVSAAGSAIWSGATKVATNLFTEKNISTVVSGLVAKQLAPKPQATTIQVQAPPGAMPGAVPGTATIMPVGGGGGGFQPYYIQPSYSGGGSAASPYPSAPAGYMIPQEYILYGLGAAVILLIVMGRK